MSTLKDAIRRQRIKNAGDNALNAFLQNVVESKVEELLKDVPAETVALVSAEAHNAAIVAVEKAIATIKKGDKGDKGDFVKGPKGDKGDKGDRGKAGSDGRSVKGPKGDKGNDGKSVKGPKGDKGKDGTEITRADVLKKINSKKGGIDISTVSGLETLLSMLQRSLREANRKKGAGGGGGGGMGNPQHEVFTISAGTTAVTTNYPIAAGGNAIFKSAYQGLVLDKDVHFTVGANRKTLTFDSGVVAQFENNTVFSLTYIRG